MTKGKMEYEKRRADRGGFATPFDELLPGLQAAINRHYELMKEKGGES
jgi:hypothetical protein